jgi:hypothetical protein
MNEGSKDRSASKTGTLDIDIQSGTCMHRYAIQEALDGDSCQPEPVLCGEVIS